MREILNFSVLHDCHRTKLCFGEELHFHFLEFDEDDDHDGLWVKFIYSNNDYSDDEKT